MKLMREFRCYGPPGPSNGDRHGPGGADGADRFAMFWVLRAVVTGPVDERTGYLCDLKSIDRMLCDTVIPRLYERTTTTNGKPGAVAPALAAVFDLAAQSCAEPVSLVSLQLMVSPFLSFTVMEGEPQMVSVTRTFEFCAAHRLGGKDLTDEENRRIFGLCGNPNWHGHNYLLEVTVRGTPDERTGTIVNPPDFVAAVRERVLDAVDHKNLNLECREFASLNPSVENMARVIWKRLDGAFGAARLASIRVWETSKTYAEYTGP